jgi:hypothetical protein
MSACVSLQLRVAYLVLFVYRAHESSCGWQDLVNENEDGLFRRQLDSLADDIDELANRQVGWNQVLLLVYGRDV